MADWYGHARSNYFQVRDKDDFIQWAKDIGDLEIIEDEQGRVGLISTDDFGGWPRVDWDEAMDDVFGMDIILEMLASHLKNGSVAILMEIGSEKMRYLTGRAVAMNSKGESVEISISDIYQAAKHLGDEITEAMF